MHLALADCCQHDALEIERKRHIATIDRLNRGDQSLPIGERKVARGWIAARQPHQMTEYHSFRACRRRQRTKTLW